LRNFITPSYLHDEIVRKKKFGGKKKRCFLLQKFFAIKITVDITGKSSIKAPSPHAGIAPSSRRRNSFVLSPAA
jgi:hypothetical protein